MNPSPLTAPIHNDLLMSIKGEPRTTSLIVAEKFNKRHDNILRAIENLECSNEFRLLNFEESSYRNEQGKMQPCYRITRDGFAFLAMGFKGKKAAVWKERFIAAFNWQAAELTRLRILHAQPDYQTARIEGKAIRRQETDVIQVFVEYAKIQGSRSASRYYLALTKETNRALFIIQGVVGKDFRNSLTSAQLANIAMAEQIVARALIEGMARKLYYREVYRITAERIRTFSGLIGKTTPGQSIEYLGAA